MIWNILGLEPTKDKNEINKAYREALKHTNPEDDPEGFKQLRNAYEEALKFATTEEVEVVKTPVDVWLDQVKEVYGDFQRRINPESWKELFLDEVCIALDKRPVAEEKLLVYLMDHWYLPQNVWQVIEDTFSIEERKEELYEKFAKDFIDYAIINGFKYPTNLPFEMFEPGLNAKDCDRFRVLYNRTNNVSQEEIDKIMDEMDELSETHPYGQAMRLRSYLDTDKDALAYSEIRKLAKRFPDDQPLGALYSSVCVDHEDYDEAKSITEHLLGLYPTNITLQLNYGECLVHEGNVEDAKKRIFKLIDTLPVGSPQVPNLLNVIKEWNEKLMIQLKEENSEDPMKQLDLGWCYLQNDRYEEALEICEKINEDELEDKYVYHNLTSKVLLSLNRTEEALPHLEWICAYLPTLEEDGTEDTSTRIKRYPEFVQYVGEILWSQKKLEEGKVKLQEAAQLMPDNSGILINLSRILFQGNDNHAALDYAEDALSKDDNSPLAHYWYAKCLYSLRRDREAFDEVNIALNLDPSQLPYYELKMNILISNQAWDAVHELMDFLKGAGADQLAGYRYFEGQIEELEHENKDEALKIYHEVAQRIEAGEFMDDQDRLYHRIASLEGDSRDLKKNKEDFDLVLGYVNKALDFNENDIPTLYYQAWMYRQIKDYDKALEIYRKLESYPTHSISIERSIAEVLYTNLGKNGAECVKYFEKLRDIYPEDDINYFYLGTTYRYMRQLDKAEEAFKKEIELAPDDIDGYKGLSFVYDYQHKFDKVLELIDTMIKMEKDPERISDYHFRRHKMYARLGEPLGAILALDECEKASPNRYYVFPAKFDIYANFGMWKAIERLFKEWKASKKDLEDCHSKEIYYYLLNEKINEAKKLIKRYGASLDDDNLFDRKRNILEYEGDYQGIVAMFEERLVKDPKDSLALVNMAGAYKRLNKDEKAKEYAAKALAILEEKVIDNKAYEPLYRTRMITVLGILGRKEEALEMAQFVRSIHFCDSCVETSCKDADILEMELFDLLGEYEKAYEIALKGRKNNPGEFDYIVEMKRLKDRGFIK